MRFPRSLAAGAVPTQGTVPPPGAAWVCWGRLPLPLGVTAVRPPFLNSGPASPSGRLAGHRHGLKFVWVPLTVNQWYPAGRPGACSPAGGFEVLLGGRVAPPRGARRNTPGSPCGSWPSCLRRLQLSFALWWPLRATPSSPRLLQAHPSAAVAPPLTLSSQARSRHAGAGVTPLPPATPMPRRTYSFAQHRNAPKLFYCCIQKPVNVPWAPTCPRPSRARVVRWGRSIRRRARIRGCGGVIAARATGGAISSLPAPGQRGTRLCGEVTLAGQGQRATPPRPPGFVARVRARAAGATRSSSRPRRPPAGAAGSRSCAPRGRGGPRSAAAAR